MATAANLVNLEAVTVNLVHRTLLDRISLGVQTGDRIGVLGLNGSGKTTLLQVLAGLKQPDSGRVATGRGTRVEVVTQKSALAPGSTVKDIALGSFGDAEHAWASDSSVRSVLDGLGLGGIGLDSPVDSLSGGERRRVALAAALVTDADLLILDEPTNHLDIEGVAWLASHLVARKGALVVVTHDRWFLDAVATLTWEVVDGDVHIREGGYSDWVFARAERLRLSDAAEERRQNLARKELAWLRRGAPARTSKPKYRIEAAEVLIADVPPPRNTVELQAFARRRLGKDVLDAEGITAGVIALDGNERILLDDVTWLIGPGDRFGIVGVNGSGKSTLLKVLLGLHPTKSGIIKRGQTVRIGYLSQEVHELPTQMRLIEAVTEVARMVNLGGKDLTAGQLCERFGFTNEQQWTRVGELSGGERRRLQMLRILMDEPNVLVLDEPTNDLDTDTLLALEDLLDAWPGTLLVVSHDRYLIERVCDNVVALMGDGKISQLVGGVEEYLRRREGMAGMQVRVSAGAAPEPAGPGLDAAAKRLLRKDLQKLEKRLESLDRKETELLGKLAVVGADYAKAAELNAELALTRTGKDETEIEWMAVSEQLESD
ncbi:ABC transporter ATP-binding protein [Nakamurella antarctica]|uniref:ABC transporter ATP-binding protein n=1 Tax=Nakamurella antarctica TaxID=1902245 RepID=A0A3G8ZTG6_9ACTN|nr:ABC-F family ATP-binding cassette domain-containing protein [Nakamurella antarctica]AZI57336.1 ABC transporter ATP-binding protein [Nakamurella antarctica]